MNTSQKDRLFKVLILLLLVGFIVGVATLSLGRTTFMLLSAFVLAYLVHPLLIYLEKRRIPRGVTILICFAVILGFLSLIFFMLIPSLIQQITDFSYQLPRLLAGIQERIEAFLLKWNIILHLDLSDMRAYITSNFQQILSSYTKPALSSLGSIFSGVFALFLWILNLALFPIFFFYLIHDYEKIVGFVMSLIPPREKPLAKSYVDRMNNILSGFIRGQLIVCLCLGTSYSLGYSLIGVPFGFLLGVIAGSLSFIPYVGASCGSIGALLLVAGSGGDMSLYIGVLIIFGIAQMLESYILTPRLVGNRVGLSPLATILGIIAGANLGGFLGMLVAVPVTAFLRLVAIDVIDIYRRKISS